VTMQDTRRFGHWTTAMVVDRERVILAKNVEVGTRVIQKVFFEQLQKSTATVGKRHASSPLREHEPIDEPPPPLPKPAPLPRSFTRLPARQSRGDLLPHPHEQVEAQWR
jgi:hypothetical protein